MCELSGGAGGLDSAEERSRVQTLASARCKPNFRGGSLRQDLASLQEAERCSKGTESMTDGDREARSPIKVVKLDAVDVFGVSGRGVNYYFCKITTHVLLVLSRGPLVLNFGNACDVADASTCSIVVPEPRARTADKSVKHAGYLEVNTLVEDRPRVFI